MVDNLLNTCRAPVAGLAVTLVTLPTVTTADSNLTYFTWAGYDLPSFHSAYGEKYGEEPSYGYFPDSEEAFQKIRHGYVGDVVHPCLPHIKRWQEEGLLQPVKPEKIPAWDDLATALTENSSVHFDDAYWMVPWEWGASSLIYRTDKVEATGSYDILMDPAFKNRLALPDNVDEMAMLATLLAGIGDPYNLSDADYDRIAEKMGELVAQARFLWTDATTVNQAMASGEIDMFWGWPNTWMALKEEGIPVNYMSDPAEGIISWTCGFVIPEDARASEEEIYDFINASVDVEAGEALIEKYSYGHSNLKSFEDVSPETLNAMGLSADVDAMLSEGNMLVARDDEQRRKLIQLWEQAKLMGGL